MFDNSIEDIVAELGKADPAVRPAVFPEIVDENKAKGDLNYVIYSIVKKYIEKHGLKYHRINDFIGGVLTCCQLELYRRMAANYEDAAIDKNGDIE